MVESRENQQIGYILRSYPRLSQTFILNEILALEEAGVSIRIFAIANPEEEIVQTQVQQIRAPVHYLSSTAPRSFGQMLGEHLRVFLRHPLGYLRALAYTLRKREIDRGYIASGRGECFRMAVSLARLIDTEQSSADGARGSTASGGSSASVHHLHAHFAHDPTFIAQLAHRITGIPYSFTAHARDLFQIPKSALVDRIKSASAVVTCCRNNLAYLDQVAPEQAAKFSMIYHGVNLQRFKPAPGPEMPSAPGVPATGGSGEIPLILSVGRLVEKKGFFDLVEALRLVKERDIRFRCLIYGEGPLHDDIRERIEERGLSGSVALAGNCQQEQLLKVFQRATLFVLTPSVMEDGDRDGIPNVLVEAMAVGLPVISTTAAGIPELVTHDTNGLLYAPHDVNGIAAGIVELLNDEGKRERLARAARPRVIEQFDLAMAACQLKTLFSQTLSSAEVS